MKHDAAVQGGDDGRLSGHITGEHRRLGREVGVAGAAMIGLGSMIGTGIFVSIGIAAGVAGPSVTLAIAVAALVAACNALSSAQLAANHAVSGGTYEYGYRWLHPLWVSRPGGCSYAQRQLQLPRRPWASPATRWLCSARDRPVSTLCCRWRS